MSKIKEIWDGWSNHTKDMFNLLPDGEIKELAIKRYNICLNCTKLKTFGKINRCGACGCALPQKAYSKTSSCPLNKW